MALGVVESIPKHSYFPGLDAVRFFAALLVVVLHYGDIINPRFTSGVILRGSWFGYIGVEIFFVISGVVIANAASAESAVAFLKSRVLRLYPAVWICATISLLLQMLSRPPSSLLLLYISTLSLVPRLEKLDVVYWTLAVEMAFYGGVFVLLAIRRFSLLPALAAFLTFYSGIFVSWLCLYDMNALPPSLSLARFVSHDTTVNMLLLQHGCLFAVGLWLWLLARRVSLVRMAGLGLACLFSMAKISATGIEVLRRHGSGLQDLWVPEVIWLAAVALIALSLFRPKSRPIRALRSVGLMTYPLYLVHMSIGVAVITALAGLSKVGALISAIVLSIGIAWLVSLYGEPTIRNILKPLLDRTLGIKRNAAFIDQ